MKKKRVVIKIGTAVLTHPSGILNENVIQTLVGEIVKLLDSGIEIILVTSGAIGAGLGRLNLKGRSLPDRQALASIGQSQLMGVYDKHFGRYKRLVGQVLLTSDDLSHRRRYLNARNTILNLLNLGVIPIINENDTVAVEEMKFGDNDLLSALVASKVEADLLIVLSDVDGLYTTDPRIKRNVKLIKEVKALTPDLENQAGGRGTDRGTGGMISKLRAARIASASGITMYIANGKKKNVLSNILEGKDTGTKILPKKEKLSSRKSWIAFGAKPEGNIIVDNGAKEALIKKGKSLLPAGIKSVEGKFDIGAGVIISDAGLMEFARGLTSYSSDDIRKIMKKKSSQIEKILGHKDYDEVIHRNNLVITPK